MNFEKLFNLLSNPYFITTSIFFAVVIFYILDSIYNQKSKDDDS